MGWTLKDGSKIAIIGGGPAGSFFSHFAHTLALKKGLDISIVIFDGKDFLQRGPRGCNLCAGVLANSLYQKLQDEGIFVPERRIINRIDGYCLHVDGESLLLSCAENEKNAIATVFRGNGPRYSSFPGVISFDDFLLSWAQDLGSKVIPQPVWEIELPKRRRDPVSLCYGDRESPEKFEADLVVGAFGVNTYFMRKIEALDFGYEPPTTLVTFQAEFKLGQERISEAFGNLIHVYMPRSRKIRYATIIPKGDYITITLIGKNDASNDLFIEFFKLADVQDKIPRENPHCLCYPRIAVSPSKNPYTDRLVMIGDASFSRHYKNGIESAFVTARLAAEAAFTSGADAASFGVVYYRKAKKIIIDDNFYGQLLFSLNDIISSIPLLSRSHLLLAREGKKKAVSRKIRLILWNMFTGNIPYREIFKLLFNLKLQITIILNMMKFGFKSKTKNDRPLSPKNLAAGLTQSLKKDAVIVVIGGGPAGSSCAIRLRKLALEKGLSPRIIIYEGKVFEKKSYYNQCLGVLSPPLARIMEEDLGIPFPWQIIQKTISGYFVHSDNNIIKLSGEHQPSYACRRVEFDNYLFQKAVELGIETINARVTDLDFSPDGVMVFSESNNLKADLVVGAFGLDDGMAKVFERISAYRQPKFLSSIVTKIHPGPQAMVQFGTYLHAFLPSSLPSVEFGAITPKGNHLTLNIAGKRVDSEMMDKFLNLLPVRKVLPENIEQHLPKLYYFKGKFPTLPAKGVIGDRYVMVGDAAGLNRPFKGKGINSALITGIRAAEAIINHGISTESFQGYVKNCSELTDDIPYGKTLRFLTIQASKFRLLDSILELAKRESRLRQAFFNIVSGQETYKKTWQQTRNAKLILKIGLKALSGKLRFRHSLKKRSIKHKMIL